MDKIIYFLSNANKILITIGCAIVALACSYKSLSDLMNGDAKGVIKIVVNFIIAFVVFVLIPTIFTAIKGALS